LLASVFGLGSESHVQACDEVLRGRRIIAGRGKAGREFAQGVISAEVGADLRQAGLLGFMSAGNCRSKVWMSTHETQGNALLSGSRVEDDEACEKEVECHCEQGVVIDELCLGGGSVGGK